MESGQQRTRGVWGEKGREVDWVGRRHRRGGCQARGVRAVAWVLLAFAVGSGEVRGQGAEGVAGVGTWPLAPAADKTRLDDGAAFLLGTLNILGIFPESTTLERVVACYTLDPTADGTTVAGLGYGGGGLPSNVRYFFVLEVSQNADSFVFVVEGYQDARENWLPILQVSAKNFKAGVAAPSYTLQAWVSESVTSPVILSALQSATFLLERSYFPLVSRVAFKVDSLVLAERRADTVEAVAVALRRTASIRRTELARLAGEEEEAGAAAAELLLEKRGILETHREALRDDAASQEVRRLHREAVDKVSGRIERVVRKLDNLSLERNSTLLRLDAETTVLERTEQHLRAGEATRKAPPTHVYLVVDSVPELLWGAPPALKSQVDAARVRRQLVLFNEDWESQGTRGWSLLSNHDFDFSQAALSIVLPERF